MTCTRPKCVVCADIARDQCPGNDTHYFNKDEAPCALCGRHLTDGHPITEKEATNG